jgi:saccharopine dehydrogenase-like NADP-dependent oxidoreductase
MKKRAIVLGCGLVGATMARELAADPEFEVVAADFAQNNLDKLRNGSGIRTIRVDLSDPGRVKEIIGDQDVVLGALPSRIGLQTLEAVIRSGKCYCDISFMPEDAMQLDSLAKKHAATAVVDCGVSPGLSNMMVGHAVSHMDRADRADIYVGGLPKVRHWPYQYKAPFAPSDVIEEYTRPARIVENGNIVVKPALSDPELMDFPQVGTLEAFNTDGLRTLLGTVRVANMREKTLRYPGHIELMRVLRETGFFDQNEIEVKGVKVRPRDVTAKLLFPRWTYDQGEEEFTILRVSVDGLEGGKTMRYTYDLYDEYDRTSGTSSMARTTGFPCVIVARMLAHRRFAEPGVFPPEMLAQRNGVFEFMVDELARRGVVVHTNVRELPE